MREKTVFLSFSILLVFIAVASAQQGATAKDADSVSKEPATHGQIVEFLQVMDMRKTLDAMVPVIQRQMREQLAQMQDQFPQMKPEDAASLASEQEQLIAGLFERMPVDKIEEDLVPIYQRHYTRPEMDAILAFYESPVGQKMRATMPAMMGEVMQVTNARMQAVFDDLMREIKQRAAQRAKKSAATDAGAPK
jgi:hypothetical protein